eukprot:TRINITY_DN8261_c0_g1_i4.p5 TRINITY_DN8261_c0_g1~~TRINITY_DN8261_c0_g1_i4.p5  ORF type:complete len:118 (+),score=3.69 TRINITY_DN8261_c0_g1_i4:482-835(+)
MQRIYLGISTDFGVKISGLHKQVLFDGFVCIILLVCSQILVVDTFFVWKSMIIAGKFSLQLSNFVLISLFLKRELQPTQKKCCRLLKFQNYTLRATIVFFWVQKKWLLLSIVLNFGD